MKENRYLLDEWEIRTLNNYKDKTSDPVFSPANGFIAVKDPFEGINNINGFAGKGIYINGFYDFQEKPLKNKFCDCNGKIQFLSEIINAGITGIIIDRERFDFEKGKISDFEKILNLKDGTFKTSLVWETKKGKKLNIIVTSFVSFAEKQLFALKYEFLPLNFNVKLKFFSAVRNTCDFSGKSKIINDVLSSVQKTEKSDLAAACLLKNKIIFKKKIKAKKKFNESSAGIEHEINVKKNQKIEFEQFYFFNFTSLINAANLLEEMRESIEIISGNGFEKALEENKKYLNDFWDVSDIEIKNNKEIQAGVRLNIFQTLQSGRFAGLSGLIPGFKSGKDLVSDESEMIFFPFFLYTCPSIAADILNFRHKTLPQALKNREFHSFSSGCLFPWKTINGEESSDYFQGNFPRYFINADISFAVYKFWEALQDDEFLAGTGAELMLETARFWKNAGGFIEDKRDKFCINGVTGPDDFPILVNNDFYTNLMAKTNLNNAFLILDRLKNKKPESYEALKKKNGFDDKELMEWRKAADSMNPPFSDKYEIYIQDDGFLGKKKLDLINITPEKLPVSMHFHPLYLSGRQVLCAPDVLTGLFNLRSKYKREDLKNNFIFYDRITVHDTHFSNCISSIMAGLTGFYDKAYEYFLSIIDPGNDSLRPYNPSENTGKVWMCIIYGFAGMDIINEVLKFDPYLPKNWDEYSFKILFRGKRIKISINTEGAFYELLNGGETDIVHGEQKTLLKMNEIKKMRTRSI